MSKLSWQNGKKPKEDVWYLCYKIFAKKKKKKDFISGNVMSYIFLHGEGNTVEEFLTLFERVLGTKKKKLCSYC